MLNSTVNTSSARNCVVALLLAAPLSGCMVGPDYRRPEVPIPAAWRVGTSEAVRISNMLWGDQFPDPVLSDLVRTGLANNKDLRSQRPTSIRPTRNTASC